MTQNDLNRAVARATDENVTTVRQRGFTESDEDKPLDPDAGTTFLLNCPACGAEVVLTDRGVADLPESAECGRCDTAYLYSFSEVFTAGERSRMMLAECA